MINAGIRSRLSWAEVVRLLAENGITTKDGAPLKPETARKAYLRMRDRAGLLKKKAKRRSQKRETPTPAVEATSPSQPAPQPSTRASTGHASLDRLLGGWDAGKAKMPKPIGGE